MARQKTDPGFRKRQARISNPPNPRGSKQPSLTALNALARSLVERGLRPSTILDVPPAPWKDRRNARPR